MGGISDVAKVGLPSKKPKDVVRWSTLPFNPIEKNKVWKAALNPLPYNGPVPEKTGPTTTQMTPEEEEAIRRRRAARPMTTVLSQSAGKDTLGG